MSHTIPSEALKGFPGPDILIGDHLRTESFFDALSKLRSVAEMRFVLIEVMVDISMHSHVEEEILYPTLRLLGHPLADHAQEEHLEVAKLVADLETRAVKDPTWIEKVCQLKRMVLTHVKEEEEVLFPFLRARLTDEELRYMGYMIALVKATAPPHPKQRPGPLLAPLAAVKYFQYMTHKYGSAMAKTSNALAKTEAPLRQNIPAPPPLPKRTQSSTRITRAAAHLRTKNLRRETPPPPVSSRYLSSPTIAPSRISELDGPMRALMQQIFLFKQHQAEDLMGKVPLSGSTMFVTTPPSASLPSYLKLKRPALPSAHEPLYFDPKSSLPMFTSTREEVQSITAGLPLLASTTGSSDVVDRIAAPLPSPLS